MKRAALISSLFAILCSIMLQGCLKDNVTPVPEFQLSDGSELLFYLEESGDYINTNEMPSLADVDEVYNNRQTYLMIDIRPPEEFSAGHIENAVNKPHPELISYLNSINSVQYPKIILISNNGQSSAFYTCLLRLYGFGNVYSMNYGMAAWNNAFSSEWLSALYQFDDVLVDFDYENEFKPDFTPLPEISLSSGSLAEKAKNRISSIMEIDYADNFTGGESDATIDFSYLGDRMNDYFIVCYNEGLLYRHLFLGISHPPGAVLYKPPPSSSDLSSTTYLQTLPSNRDIAFYSTDGQLSAFAVAYMQVLGYNAKSVLFGANNMFYNIMLRVGDLNAEAFTTEKIRNYPYVTGN